jgi:FkbM family methyltransferase
MGAPEYTQRALAYLRLRGETLKDNLYIQLAKTIYSLYRFYSFFFPLKYKHIGNFLIENVTAITSYGKFYCRKYEEDLGIISDAYEIKTIKEFISLSKGKDLVIDVGAHIGKYTILAAKLSKKVIAIEPNKENFTILERNIRLNRLNNVYALNLAAFNKNSKLKLYIGDTSGQHSIFKKYGNYQSVDGIKLDSLFKRLNIKKVDLIKIDVEGAELQVLLGMLEYLKKRRVKNIIIEVKPNNLRKIKRLFEKLGYLIKKIEDENYIVTTK